MHGCLAGFSDMLSHSLFLVKMVKGSGGVRITCRLDEAMRVESGVLFPFYLHVLIHGILSNYA